MVDKHEQEIKKTIRKTYSKIALQHDNNADSSCCAPGCCSGGHSPVQPATVIDYEPSKPESEP